MYIPFLGIQGSKGQGVQGLATQGRTLWGISLSRLATKGCTLWGISLSRLATRRQALTDHAAFLLFSPENTPPKSMKKITTNCGPTLWTSLPCPCLSLPSLLERPCKRKTHINTQYLETVATHNSQSHEGLQSVLRLLDTKPYKIIVGFFQKLFVDTTHTLLANISKCDAE